MKKFLVMILGLVLALGMVGCGGSESDVPEEDAVTVEEPVEEEPAEALIDPDFKAAMDNYEEFMDEYVAFMEKYAESDNSMEMLTDYMDYLQKYQEVVAAFDEIDEEALNDAELAYYTEVSLRVSQKLLAASENL